MARSFPLTLISASAGSGKTTLLSAWVAAVGDVERERTKTPCAWLSLDALDNDAISFWDSVIAALRTCLPAVGETALAMLHAHQSPPLSTILVALLNELAEQEKEIVLILDDYHVISDQTIEEAMRFLLDHLPANLHLVLSTRIDPDLPLSRLRMRGQLVEIRDQDLRFTPEEASHFLTQRMTLSLSEEDVATLHQRTEGWIAGLQLAALSLRKQPDRSAWISNFAGSHRYLLDYIQQEILAQLSVPLQHFLLQTSILTSMNADLCQAVTEAPTQMESQQMIEELERANLFVVPLDEERQWYRYHDLFREALLTRLQARQPQWLPLLHLRAARWYEAAGLMREAVAHALAADYPYAANLMEQVAPGFWLNGEAKTVHTWVMGLPNTVLGTKAHFALSAVFRLQETLHMSAEMLQGRTHAQIEQSLVRIEEVLQNRTSPVLPESEMKVLKRRLLLMRGWRAGFELTKIGDAVTLSQLVQEMQEVALEEDVTWKMIPCILTYWLRETLQREGGLLVPMLEQIEQEAKRSGDPLILLRVMSMLTLAYFKAGRLRRAEQEGLAALELAKHSGIQTYVTGYLHYWLGLIYYQHNQIEEAFQSIQRELRIARLWQQVDLLRVGAHFLTQIALARGNFAVAEQALQELEQIYQRHPLAYIPPWTAAARVWYWLKAGNLAAAQQWADQSGLDPQRWDPNQKSTLLMLVRVYLAQQQSALALQTLQRFRQHLDRPGDLSTAIEWMTLYVAALYLSGDREQAMCIATQLVQMTEPEGAIRVYLDASPPMKQVLKALLAAPQDDEPDAPDASISRPYVLRLLATFQQQEDRSMQQRVGSSAATPKTLPYAPPNVAQQGLSEPLSRQEQRVLPLLVAGRTYGEMAREMTVSVHTIKTQVNSIYRKLGVSRRAEAIAVAQRLRLF
jgi:LuxR family maltose regulon positive regulatory protein